MSILCIFLVISRGWTLLDALSYIVHLYSSLARKQTKICSYFCGIIVVKCFCIVCSSVISFSHVLCVPQSYSFF